MKSRAGRVTHAAAVLETVVLGVLVVLNWDMVRDHVEAWQFQLTEGEVMATAGLEWAWLLAGGRRGG